MAYILTISIPNDSQWIIDELKKLDGSTSGHVVQAIKAYLEAENTKPPFWFVPGKDYSQLLTLEERKALVKYGYRDHEVE